MNEKLKIICFVLITIAVVISAIFYCWDVWERQKYFERERRAGLRDLPSLYLPGLDDLPDL